MMKTYRNMSSIKTPHVFIAGQTYCIPCATGIISGEKGGDAGPDITQQGIITDLLCRHN